MSSLAWRIKRLRAMRPQEILFRLRQAGKIREEMRRSPSDLAQRAAELLETLPMPAQTRVIRFFDYEVPYSGDAPDWHMDVHTGIVVPRKRWPEIDYRKADDVGLAKNVWELNRHHFLEEWARERSEDAALAVTRVILDWIVNNPRPMGINWASSLEPAFRMMSWQRAFETLPDYKVHEVICSSAWEQGEHILRFPSLYSSANNHLVGELTGLLAGGSFLGPPHGIGQVLIDLKKQIRLQVTPDGVDREQAVFYHDYVLGFLQRAKHYVHLMEMSDDAFFDSYIERMFEFSDWMQFDENKCFEIGDRDDGVPPIERLAPYAKKQGIAFWKEGGYAVWHGDNASACFRAGNFGYPSIAAHAHCDQLSVLLVADGNEILTDSGTYCYHEDEEMRKYFKGTSAHNTIRVDGLDQAEYGGPFLWSTHADAEIAKLDDNTFEGSHRGYLRLQGEVWPKRRVTFGGSQLLAVVDKVGAKGTHDYELFWNLGPQCSVSTIGENSVELECGGHKYRLKFSSDREIEVTIGEGKYSRKFGKMQQIPRIEVRTKAQSWSITTLVERI